MITVKDTDRRILEALAFACVPFTKSDILDTAKLLGHRMASTKTFLQEHMTQEHYITEESTYFGVTHYQLEYTAWKELLETMPEEVYNFLCGLHLCIGSKYSFSFSKAFWQFTNKKRIDTPLVKTMKKDYNGYGILLPVEYKKEMVFDPELVTFVAKGYIEDEVLQEITYNLATQNFGQEAPKAILTYLELIDGAYDPDTLGMLKTKTMFSYRFMRLLDIKGILDNSMYADKRHTCIYESFLLMQKGQYDDAVKIMFKYLSDIGVKAFGDSIMDFYYAIALTYSSLPASEKRRGTLLKNYNKIDLSPSAHLFLMMEKGQYKAKDIETAYLWHRAYEPIERALLLFLFERYGLFLRTEYINVKEETFKFVDEHGIGLLQLEMSACFDRFEEAAEEICKREPGLHPTLSPLKKLEEWDSVLNDVLQINGSAAKNKNTAAKSSQTRIVYELNTHTLGIKPRLQKSKDGVTWTAGRNIAMEKFTKGKAEGMTEVDHAVASCVDCYSYGWYSQVEYELSGGKAVAALVGHPNVYDAITGQRLDVVEEKPVLTVDKKETGYKISTDVNLEDLREGYYVTLETGQKVKVVKVPTKVKKTLELLRNTSFPEAAKDKLTKVLELVSNDMVVMSDLIKANENISTKHTHPETVVQLQPQDDTIHCHTFVRPFGSVPPVCKPGKGMQVITTSMDGKQVQTKRNLKKETENYEAVKSLLVDCYTADDYSWTLEPEECLLLLEQLQAMPGQCSVEWPEGGQLNVVRPQLYPSDFNISVGNVAGWFEISGDIQIDEKKKIKMAELIEGFSKAKGNFISLGNNDFVRITSQLKKYIDRIARVTSVSKGKLRLSPFNVSMIEDLGKSGMELHTDKAYKDLIKRVEAAENAEIKIPRAINAELRDYQKEGYRWMSRLAAWGAGALLADDMGLGKTLQTITLLLSRAAQGPQLVIVPTSLVMNWRDEIARFAPSLNVSLLNSNVDARKDIVSGAKEYEVVIATYGLLVTEEELLTGREWITIVLDEAHTIKNRDTKMSKVAMKLQSKFRVLLTGTPLQNHLSEIWNLMQFANPSLLGTFQEFSDRFIVPVERDHDKERQQLLRRIISPFLLRRTKSEVLNELPEKTEVTVKVDLSPDEWAFYDNIRQQALAAMENTENNAMQAIAEITRLRQAACDVRLVEKKLDIPSSKQEAFMQLVSDLHDNHHRALVFSQFTSHLALIRQRLDKEGIKYLYLDGSTTAKERIRLVEEFQHGDMPIFLISLKAGGLGLNLTAADYIVHLDPWWNPAIEDQASDRAYRIGQQNPVTIYRIIAAGTIEEKIISLHQTKKNLADALLEGSDVSAAMTRDEMLALLRETM